MADTQFIVDEIEKSRPWAIGMGALIAGLSIGLIFIPVEEGAAAWVPYGKWVMIALFFALAVLLLVSAIRPSARHPAVLLLTQTPERIVWAHVAIQRTNGAHTSTTLILHTDQGKRLSAPLPRTAEGEQRGLALVRAVAPRAAIGYSPEFEHRFKKDPASLRQA